jgi:hypothetical protein
MFERVMRLWRLLVLIGASAVVTAFLWGLARGVWFSRTTKRRRPSKDGAESRKS